MALLTQTYAKLTEPRERRTWTVMVYMAADKSAELDATAVQDLREMERGANGSAHIVVQINRAWPDSFQRYEVRKSPTDPRRGQSLLIEADGDTTDMGEQKTLAQFLRSVPAMFPAEHYFLVLWGHAYGLGFGRDHNNKLTLKELRASLEDFRKNRNEMLEQQPELKALQAGSDGRLDLLGTNACAMSYVEAAWELRTSAQYMVASQISVPFAGWPYESILRRVADTPKPHDLGKLVVDLYVGHYNSQIRGERVAMSILDLKRLENQPGDEKSKSLKTLIEELAQAIRGETQIEGPLGKGRGPVRDVFIGAAAGDVRPLIDCHDLCQDFQDAQSPVLRKVAEEVQTFLKERVVIHHGEHPDLEELKGIGIFAPFVTDEEDLKRLQLLEPPENGRRNGMQAAGPKEDDATGQDEYQQLDIFGKDATWPRLVYDDLRQEISPELVNSIIGLDASSREDRRDVTQIILAIDSAFNKLDRVLSAARGYMGGNPPNGNGTTSIKNAYMPAANGHARRFGLPWLKLIQPVTLETQLARLRQRRDLDDLRGSPKTGQGRMTAARAPVSLGDDNPGLVNIVIDFLSMVESAVGEVERATRRGLTHPRLGIGPAYSGQLGLDGSPKPGLGLDGSPKPGLGLDGSPKPGLGLDGSPKPGLGLDGSPKPGLGEATNEIRAVGIASSGDLRLDLALSRVADLFQEVVHGLRALEQATLAVEVTARTVLADAQTQDMSHEELLAAASHEVGRAFGILEEASNTARRTVRRVLGHPSYGLGPSVAGIGLEERQALASAGGLDRRTLRLL